VTPHSTRSNEGSWRTRLLVILAIGLLTAVALSATGCSKKAAEPATTTPAQTAPAEPASTTPSATTEVTQLEIKDVVEGKGAEVNSGDTVTVNYTGWLLDGTKFDSSLDRNEPFEFTVGAGKVIQGWDEGLAGMKVGGKRELLIPSAMGYGEQGAGGVIPPNASLKFEIDLLKVTPAAK